MTLHEYNRRGRKYETTGRATTFLIPRKFLRQNHVYDNQTPLTIYMIVAWNEGQNGQVDFVSRLREDGSEMVFDNHKPWPNASISFFQAPSGARLIERSLAARASREPFPGYSKPAGTPYGIGSKQDIYLIREDECGFDVFEHDSQRGRARDLGLPVEADTRDDMEAPLNLGRIFAYPSGADRYHYVLQCQDGSGMTNGFCNTGLRQNEYLTVRFVFGSPMVCKFPSVVQAYFDFIGSRSTER